MVGLKGFTTTVHEMNVRPGGVWRFVQRGPDGNEYAFNGVYREIVAPERIVFVVSFSDEKGGVTRHPLSPTWPLEVLNTMTLSEHDGKTTIIMHGVPINATEEERKTFEAGFDSMQQGFKGTLDQLDEYLAKA